MKQRIKDIEKLAEEYDNKYEERRKKKDKGGKGKKICCDG